MVPSAGHDPAISTLRGWRVRQFLYDGMEGRHQRWPDGTGVQQLAGLAPRVSVELATAKIGPVLPDLWLLG